MRNLVVPHQRHSKRRTQRSCRSPVLPRRTHVGMNSILKATFLGSRLFIATTNDDYSARVAIIVINPESNVAIKAEMLTTAAFKSGGAARLVQSPESGRDEREGLERSNFLRSKAQMCVRRLHYTAHSTLLESGFGAIAESVVSNSTK